MTEKVCPKCENPPILVHSHGECLPSEWTSWDFTPPNGWEVNEELTYLTEDGILIIRLEKSQIKCPKCKSRHIGLEDIDCGESGYYRDIPTCYDCGHQFDGKEKVRK